jgi:hypothetical protein
MSNKPLWRLISLAEDAKSPKYENLGLRSERRFLVPTKAIPLNKIQINSLQDESTPIPIIPSAPLFVYLNTSSSSSSQPYIFSVSLPTPSMINGLFEVLIPVNPVFECINRLSRKIPGI